MIDWTIVLSIVVAVVILGAAYILLMLIAAGEGPGLFWLAMGLLFIAGIAAFWIGGAYYFFTRAVFN